MDAERGLLALATRTSTGLKTRATRQGLARLLDPAARVIEERVGVSGYLRHHVLHAMMRGMLMLDRPPQAWSAEDWGAVRKEHGHECHFWLIAVAAHGYDVLPGPDYNYGDDTPRLRLARAVFGQETVEAEVVRVRSSLTRMGFVTGQTRVGLLRYCIADMLLFHSSPSLDVVTDASLSAYADHAPSRAARRLVSPVSAALVEMGIVTRRVSYFRPRERETHWKRLGVSEEWLGWCKRWQGTSSVAERTRRSAFGDLMTAGRWLRRDHPEITTPTQWTLDLAFGFVRFVDGMQVGELLAAPRPNLRMGQPLTPNSKASICSALRCFFHDLQQWDWIEAKFSPQRGFALPRQVQRSRGHNPRPIDEGFWLKLRTASLSLRQEDLPQVGGQTLWRYSYPLELIQALAIAWTFSGCRSNEIERLEVGCAYVEHVPAQFDPATGEAVPAFDQPMLRVPVSKTQGEFVKPIERPLLDAIAAWTRLRPVQPASRDSTTGQMVQQLFCYRGRRVGHGILNYAIIPILLRRAGLPDADSRGPITSHRARATLATKLYNGASGLGPLEVMNWLGHTHFSSTQYYLALTPVRLMTAFHKGAKLTENLRMVSVVVDGKPGPSDPVFHYDLGHGFCTNPAYAACAHRMACAKCDFYEPAESFAKTLARQADRYNRMLQQLDLTEDERAAATGDAEAVGRLLTRLADQPTPDRAAPSCATLDAGRGGRPTA